MRHAEERSKASFYIATGPERDILMRSRVICLSSLNSLIPPLTLTTQPRSSPFISTALPVTVLPIELPFESSSLFVGAEMEWVV